jgi:replication-associated recombination protein RarA
MDILNGKVPFPTTKCGILLYGVWGTGKSELAKLIPDAIEMNKTGSSSNYHYSAIGSGNDGVKVITKIEQQAWHYPFNASHHYFVLDEVDRLKPEVMLSLKQVMNLPNSVFILTTNNLSAIDKGVLSRCVRVDFNAACNSAWLPKVKRILADYGVTRTDKELLDAIDLCKGDAREILYTAQRIVANDLEKAA